MDTEEEKDSIISSSENILSSEVSLKDSNIEPSVTKQYQYNLLFDEDEDSDTIIINVKKKDN